MTVPWQVFFNNIMGQDFFYECLCTVTYSVSLCESIWIKDHCALFYISSCIYLEIWGHSNKPYLKIRMHSTEKLVLIVHVVAINTCQGIVNSNLQESSINTRYNPFNTRKYFATPNTLSVEFFFRLKSNLSLTKRINAFQGD